MKVDYSETTVHICRTFLCTEKALFIDLGTYFDKIKHKRLRT